MPIAERLHAGLVHVNDQTVNDEVIHPFAGTGASGNHTNRGGPADIGEYTQWRWMTIQDSAAPLPDLNLGSTSGRARHAPLWNARHADRRELAPPSHPS